MATAGKAKSKLVNGQRINIATGANMGSSIDSNQSSSPDNSISVALPSGKTLTGEAALNYGKTPGAIDTSQPSPQGVEVGAGLPGGPQVPFAEALKGVNQNDRGAVGALASKYKQALPGLQAGGEAPQDAGVGKMTAQGAVNQFDQTPPASPLAGIIDTDAEPNFTKSILEFWDDYNSPENQKTSLVEEYKSMSKELGIEDINEELIDAKKIIEGTEDDIRSEITAAGGFGTDSQVLALANARNKSLIKNYNVLLETRDNAMTQLSTMMQLTVEDRKAAENEFDRKMNFAFKVQEFQQKAKDNSTSQLNKIVDNIGYGGLLAATNGNAYEQSLIEKTLGLGAGGLAKAASYVKPLTAMDQLELENKKLTNQKLRQDISGGGSVSSQVVDVNGKKLLINSKTGETIKEIGAGETGSTTAQTALAENNIQLIDTLKTHGGLTSAVGPNVFARIGTLGIQEITGKKQDFTAGVQQLTSQLTLDNLIQAKARGATFGALSEGELNILSGAASKLNSWARKDKSGNVLEYDTSEKAFKAELDKISNFAKLDYILKGGDPAAVGVQTMPDGTHWTQNSNGSMTQI